mmetsp:Transcript_56388/g.91289  ORF Transcript_56388/g.91289 Transcript_56388/m.91289 type:complete len:295 (+) Transcript_56388:53-937(+)
MSAPVKADIVIGCVAYCDAIGSIWDGMKGYFATAGVKMDFVLFTSYEAQVDALMKGHIDIAWNGPLAHVRTQKLTHNASISLGMRDVDCNFKTHIIATKASGISVVADLAGKKLATGSVDSPQAYILPLQHIKTSGVALDSLHVTRFDKDIGKHGDTAMGEVEVIKALEGGQVDAGLVSDLMWSRAVNAGDIEASGYVIISDGPPLFDHCQFDALPTFPKEKQDAFNTALFAMTWDNAEHRRVMQLEGIKKEWARPREEGYANMRAALADEANESFPPMFHSVDKHPFKSLVVT